MKKAFFAPLLLVPLLSSFAISSAAANEWHVAGSYSADQLRGVRTGYRITDIPLSILKWVGDPKLHLEAAVNYWQNSNNASDDLAALTISPILAWQLTEGARPLYLEAGIGGSYFEQTHLSNRRLSTQFQFEDRIGLSWQYSSSSDARITLSYFHYSNADIKRPNDGLDFFTLSWTTPL